jgi:hypothetical protein
MKKYLYVARVSATGSGAFLGFAVLLFLEAFQNQTLANNSLLFRGAYHARSSHLMASAFFMAAVSACFGLVARWQNNGALSKHRALKDEVAGLKLATARA